MAAIFLGGLILSTLLGKFSGVSMAMVRYRRTCLELQDRLRKLEV